MWPNISIPISDECRRFHLKRNWNSETNGENALISLNDINKEYKDFVYIHIHMIVALTDPLQGVDLRFGWE